MQLYWSGGTRDGCARCALERSALLQFAHINLSAIGTGLRGESDMLVTYLLREGPGTYLPIMSTVNLYIEKYGPNEMNVSRCSEILFTQCIFKKSSMAINMFEDIIIIIIGFI